MRQFPSCFSIGDSLVYHNNSGFSTFDYPVVAEQWNCAEQSKGAWWYNLCLKSNLNGFNYNSEGSAAGSGIVWDSWRGMHHSLREVQMAIYPTCELISPQVNETNFLLFLPAA